MREILFRGKRIDSGEWVSSGNIICFNPEGGKDKDLAFIPALNEPCICDHDENGNIISFEKGMFYKVDTKTVGQYTGLLDKNGERIFEGDVLTVDGEDGFFVLEFQEDTARFVMYGDSIVVDFDNFWSYEVEVMGNIHDNPEYLEEGEEE